MLCSHFGMVLLLMPISSMSLANGSLTKCGTERICNYEAVCELNEGKPLCRCIGGRYFAGEFCTEQVDNCDPSPCQTGVPCTNALGQPICGPCADGFGGHACDIAKAGLFTKMYLHHNRYGHFATDQRFLLTVESLGGQEFMLEFFGDNYAIDAFPTNPRKSSGRWQLSTDLPKVAAEHNLHHGHLMPYKVGYFYVATARFWKLGPQKLQLRASDINTLVSYVDLDFSMLILSKDNRCRPEIELNHCADPFNPLLLDIERFVTIEPVVRKRCSTDSTMLFEWTVFNSVETVSLYKYGQSRAPRLKMPPYPPWARYSGEIVQSYMIRIGVTENTPTNSTYVVTRCYVFVYTKPVVATITGSSERELDAAHAIQFDASKSRDLGMPPHSQWKVTYQWSCSSETDPGNKFCTSLAKQGKTFAIPAGALKDSMSYKFVLVVRSRVNKQSTDRAAQTLKLASGMSLVLDIECVRNCRNRKFTPNTMLHLKARCLNCKAPTAQRLYAWTVTGGVAIATNNTRLVVEQPTDVATFTATVRLTSGNIQGSATIKLEQNKPPAGGKCSISPKAGREFETSFHISCSDFEDDDQPLSYEFAAESFVLDRTSEPSTELRLPKTKRIQVSVCDVLRACAVQLVDVNVDELAVTDVESTLKQPETDLRRLLRNGDFNRAMVLTRRLLPLVKTTETAKQLVDHLQYTKLVTLLNVEQYAPVVGNLFTSLSKLSHAKVAVASITVDILADGFQRCLLDKEVNELKAENFRSLAEDFGTFFQETIAVLQLIPAVQSLQEEHVNVDDRLAEQYHNFSDFDPEILTHINSWLRCSISMHRCLKYLGLTAAHIYEPSEPKIRVQNGDLVHELFEIEQSKNRTIATEDSHATIRMSSRMIHSLQDALHNRGVLIQMLSVSQNPFWWYPSEQPMSTNVLYFSAFSRDSHPLHFDGVHLNHALEFTLKLTASAETTAQPSPMLGHLRSTNDINIFHIPVAQNALVVIRFTTTSHNLRILMELNRRPTGYRVLQSSQVVNATNPNTTVMLRNDDGNDGSIYLAVIPAGTTHGADVFYSFVPELRLCLSWSFRYREPQWSTLSCKPTLQDTTDELRCLCHHMSIYAGKVFASPAFALYNTGNLYTEMPVNWFVLLLEAGLGIAFVACTLIAYVSLDPNRENLVTAPKDINVMEKLNKDKEIVVRINTGGYRNSSTTAGVLLTIDTVEGAKKFKIYQNPQRPHLGRNTTCTVRLPIDPNTLKHPITVIIKHDGGGRYPTWYCRSLEVNYVGAAQPVVLEVEHWIAEKTIQVSAPTDQPAQSEANEPTTNAHKHRTFCNALETHFINWFQWQPLIGPWKYGNQTCNRMERTFILILKFAVTVAVVCCYYGWTTLRNYEEERVSYERLDLDLLHVALLSGLSFALVNLIQFGTEFWLLKSSKKSQHNVLV